MASLLLVLATAPSCLSQPVEKDAEYWRNQAKVRATLITKDNFKNPRIREEKSGLVPLPEPFVISTALNIDTGSNGGGSGSSSRSGRSGFDSKKSTPEEEKSILVEGMCNSTHFTNWNTVTGSPSCSFARQVALSISLSFLNGNASRHIFLRCLDIQNFSSLSLVLSKLF